MGYRQARVIEVVGTALCVDRQDRLYAAGDAQVRVYDRAGQPLRQWKVARAPSAVAVAADGTVYVGESGQIEVFDSGAKLTRTFNDEGRLGLVTAIGFWREFVLVADAKDRSIHRYDRSLRLLGHIGKDNRTKGFLIPNGVLDFDVDAKGIIHAANPGKHRVERYTCEGQLLGHIGRFDGVDPEGFPGCCNPTNVALGPAGQVFVTEKADPRAKVLDANGKLVAVIADRGFDPASKNMDIAVDSKGRVYVADAIQRRILVFENE